MLISKLFAAILIPVLQVYAFLGVVWLVGIEFPHEGYFAVLAALLIYGFMLGALGLLLSSTIRQLDNFADAVNFVVLPVFLLPSALYPLSIMSKASPLLSNICVMNSFTHAVELIRFALYGQWNLWAPLWVCGTFLLFLAGSL